ncbi:MAG TPA: ABC transporter ATP-binding protein [Spirochaetia bacterium]|nr:ABC transporter ATP-binding protein [Spirochaetia bacterium]
MPLLEVKDLVVHYGKINALKRVSLSVEEGQIVTLIGANGAGKTTLLTTISGLMRASSGDILFDGRDISDERADHILAMGVAHVPEGRRVFSELTVEENLRAGAYILNDRSRIQQLLERSYTVFPKLAEMKEREAGTLSGGEQQMLAIARGLMSDPRMLLLDEPSLGLAPILVERIFDLIVEIQKLGKSILLVEQNANIALQVASYGYVIETGKITLENTTTQLLESDTVRKAYLGIA